MGIPTKVTSFRLRDGSLREISELQDAFAPAFKTRTSMVEWLISVGHTIFVRHQGEEILRQAQRLLCITRVPSEASAAVSAAPISAGTAESSRPSKVGRSRVLIEQPASRLRFRYPVAAVGLGFRPFGTSFGLESVRVFAGGQA